MNIIVAIQVAILLYFAYAVLIQLVLAIASQWTTKNFPAGQGRKTFAIFIPAYKEDKVIEQTVQSALNQQYAPERYRVIVIADNLKKSTLANLSKYPIQIIQYASPERTKTKAIRKALGTLPNGAFDIALVLDADNQLAPHFLQEIEAVFEQGFKAVQGLRTAANLDTPMAVLDGAAEVINHRMYGKGALNVGQSARLMGSGMAFDLELFRELIMQSQAVGGFDKELEMELAQRKEPIFFAEKAIVFDEKVRSQAVYKKQRRRWISAQLFYFRKYWKAALLELTLKGKVGFFFKWTLLAVLPRIILPFALSLVSIFYWLLSGWTWLSISMLGLLVIHLATLLYLLPKSYYTGPNRKAWINLFSVIWCTLGILGRLKGANRTFIHTPHGK